MATAFCHYSNCPITRACCSLSDPSSSNNRHLGSIKFSLSSDYLDLRSKPSKAKLRVCLKFASSRIIAPGHIIVIASPRLNGHRITSNLADRKVQILPNVGNISDGKSVAPTPNCHWTDFNVQSSVLSAFKRLLKSSERNDQVFLSYEIHVRTIATGSPSRKLGLVKVGREHQPVLVIGREADIEVSSDNTLYHQQPVDQASGKGREPRHQNSEKPRRSSRSARPSQSACRVTKMAPTVLCSCHVEASSSWSKPSSQSQNPVRLLEVYPKTVRRSQSLRREQPSGFYQESSGI